MITSNKIPTPLFSDTPFRVALVGVTGYGASYLESLTRLVDSGRVEWAAVTIVNPESAADAVAFFEKRSVPIYDDYLDMIEKESGKIDWICIPTAIGWHTRMVIESLRRGLQVTVEKPLAPTLQDVAAIQKVEKEVGIEVSVGFQYAYQPETWEIKERILGGEIGDIQLIDCLALWPRTRSYYARNRWAGKLHDGNSWVLDSPLHNGLCHLINLILFWSGDKLDEEADLSSVKTEMYRSKPIESYDTVRSVVTMGSGIKANVVLSHSTDQRFDPEIHIVGTKGKIVWRFLGDYEVFVAGKRSFYPKSNQLLARDNMFDAILDRIAGKPAKICTTNLAKGTVKWVNAVHDTAEIHDIPEKYRLPLKGEFSEVVDAVEKLDYYSLRSFHERKSFEQLGVPWAVPARERDVSEYKSFEGKYIPPTIAPSPVTE
ncbi:Gfo/Idh/MocA family oxidoreductase [Puniceicoccaceae bacterium K14]|nr:Gfo/Idh/MocA family oxidoreductase [Puniceicoccaceae bacterium K14]